MKFCRKSPYQIRLATPKDEHRAQRKGGFNYGIETIIFEDESQLEWDEFVEELFIEPEPPEEVARQSDVDATR